MEMDSGDSDAEAVSLHEDINEDDDVTGLVLSDPSQNGEMHAKFKQQEEDEREEIRKEYKSHQSLLKDCAFLTGQHLLSSAYYTPAPFHPFLSPLSLSQLQSTSSLPKQERDWRQDSDQQFKSSQQGQPSSQHCSITELYELSDDPNRKNFLDELFAFMQKRGTPINRLPIMAKQVLDLYELYNLVVARGGLVEVIYKKLWQEIIKGLKLPSSITSAAFTLRTQYMKYLYPFECEKERLSTPPELQAAIDGNRREGRRSHGFSSSYPETPPRGSYVAPPSIPPPRLSPLNLGATRSMTNGISPQARLSLNDPDSRQPPPQKEALNLSDAAKDSMKKISPYQSISRPAEEDNRVDHVGTVLPTANIKVTNRGENRNDGSLLVSMEVNGVIYQGVLFAQSHLMGTGNSRLS